MGALVTKRGSFGQWGSRLYVSTPEAERVCQRVWDVPAEFAQISFTDKGEQLLVERAPDQPASTPPSAGPTAIAVSGWRNTRTAAPNAQLLGSLPLLWTPEIKALWTPFILIPAPSSSGSFRLHPLRISATSIQPSWCPQAASASLGVPLPVGLSVDGVRIEIGDRQPDPL